MVDAGAAVCLPLSIRTELMAGHPVRSSPEVFMLARRRATRLAVAGAFSLALSLSATADSTKVYPLNNAGPVFGLAADAGSLLVADAGAGIVRLRNDKTELVAALPGVSDVAAVHPFTQLAITGGGADPSAAKLYRVVRGMVTELGRSRGLRVRGESRCAGGEPQSIRRRGAAGRRCTVSDAGGNSLLHVDRHGTIDWIATLPVEMVSTDNIKMLIGFRTRLTSAICPRRFPRRPWPRAWPSGRMAATTSAS
jgi:hypothetical protein